jgi:pimeloyl-ACP methyl ester carboxylesterase
MKPTVIALIALAAACGAAQTNTQDPKMTIDPQNPKPTIVLVHGAFADSSSWNGVVQRLAGRGYTAIAAPNTLRGVDADAAVVASVLKSIAGPIVLVGHSYGGMVISQAAQGNANVKALVYIAAFMPDTGESVATISAGYPATKFGPPVLLPVPTANGVDVYLKRDVFHDTFCADVPAATAALMAATQRPIDGAAVPAPFAGVPAWKSIPSWALVAKADTMIGPVAEKGMAERAHAHIVEVNASHAVAVSQPDAVADLIVEAAHSVH